MHVINIRFSFFLTITEVERIPCDEEGCVATFITEEDKLKHWEERHRVSFITGAKQGRKKREAREEGIRGKRELGGAGRRSDVHYCEGQTETLRGKALSE